MAEQTTRRPTRQRTAVVTELSASRGFRSAQEIHASLTEAGQRISLATVYRTLTTLASDGEVDMLRTDDGESAYRMCSSGHHHHLVCRECGATVEVEGPVVERWADQVSATHGYRDVEHTLEIFGRCGDC